MIITTILLLLLIFFSTDCDKKIEKFLSEKTICNRVDGRCYDVSVKYGDQDDQEEASELLGYLNNFAIELLRALRKKYLLDNYPSEYRQNMIKFLLNNYNPDKVKENVPVDTNNTSYVEDKGKIFAMCLREKSSGKNKFHKKHILEFVLMHEIAHLTCFSIGHNHEFWHNFKLILTDAKEFGIHTPIDYKKYQIKYCGLSVDYSPYFDDDIVLKK